LIGENGNNGDTVLFVDSCLAPKFAAETYFAAKSSFTHYHWGGDGHHVLVIGDNLFKRTKRRIRLEFKDMIPMYTSISQFDGPEAESEAGYYPHGVRASSLKISLATRERTLRQ